MGMPRPILLCLLGATLCLTESQALQCFNFEHTYYGPFDLSGKALPTASCPSHCFEAVSSVSTGYRSSVTLVKKGCWSGAPSGQMEVNHNSLPPDFSVVRGCSSDLCNVDILSHDSLPNLSPAPNPPLLSGTECYACVGTSPEDCTANKSRRVQCHLDESVCFRGNGRMTIANTSVPVYIRTCHRPSCTIAGTTSPWTDIDLQGTCCQGNLCNGDSVIESLEAAAASPRAPPSVAQLLLASLLVGALGGSLGLSS
ncbi:ly6/PLAUR domain-containing protein 5 [Tenrec ecaudatus]|uniref:ly6/PLAUR domain-containing protein 5 n=1 Tax=Tenrec ecaudatus TaxID=94439 RepID=UPI003F59C875